MQNVYKTCPECQKEVPEQEVNCFGKCIDCEAKANPGRLKSMLYADCYTPDVEPPKGW